MWYRYNRVKLNKFIILGGDKNHSKYVVDKNQVIVKMIF